MSFRSPLGRARGLGSAKEGAGHWLQQRVTAIALIPLSLWFLAQVIRLSADGDYAAFVGWVSVPGNTALLILLLGMLFHHAQLGLQVVLEDYVHNRAVKVASVLGVKFLALLLFVFSVVAVVRAAFVGG